MNIQKIVAKEIREIDEAKCRVGRKFDIGGMAFDSAADIYKHGLAQLGVDTGGISSAAYKEIFIAHTHATPRFNATARSSFLDAFPEAAHIGEETARR